MGNTIYNLSKYPNVREKTLTKLHDHDGNLDRERGEKGMQAGKQANISLKRRLRIQE